jgi:prepilin-type N-terminal cleavage/methylation domain-containing protein
MRRTRLGFSLIELIIARLIGSILTSIALTGYGNVQGRFAVRGARSTFATMHARARAQAIEKGATVRLVVSVAGDSVYLLTGTTTLENIRFDEEFHVDLRSSGGDFTLCMNSRGYADTACNSFSSPPQLYFYQNADSVSATVLPLGQLVY